MGPWRRAPTVDEFQVCGLGATQSVPAGYYPLRFSTILLRFLISQQHQIFLVKQAVLLRSIPGAQKEARNKTVARREDALSHFQRLFLDPDP
jgi:hypothetical protein